MFDVRVIVSKWVKVEAEIMLYEVDRNEDARELALEQANDPGISKDWEPTEEENAEIESEEWL